MRDDIVPAGRAAHRNGLDRLRHRADLIELDEGSVRHPLYDATRNQLLIRNIEIVADNLYGAPELRSLILKSLPIVFTEAVFDRDEPKVGAMFCLWLGRARQRS